MNNARLLAVMMEMQTGLEGAGNHTFIQPGTGTTVREEAPVDFDRAPRDRLARLRVERDGPAMIELRPETQ